MQTALEMYQHKEITRKELISSVEINGRALENMSYALIKELDEIEYKLTRAQFADEDSFLPDEEEAVQFLVNWLEKIPK